MVRDLSDPAVPGRYSICYVNAFQTQPGADWPDDLVLDVEDREWPGGFLLDTSTPGRRARILARVGGWIDGCAARGFDAVELDNLDSWTRSQGRLDRAGNVALAVALVDRGHARGLAVAQKNAAELAGAVAFDFAAAEECQAYDECDAYLEAHGDAVAEIEYDAAAFAAACAARGPPAPGGRRLVVGWETPRRSPGSRQNGARWRASSTSSSCCGVPLLHVSDAQPGSS